MTPPRRNRQPTLIVLALAILFILLAILEVMAGELTPPTSDPAAAWMIHIGHIEDALAKRDIGAAERQVLRLAEAFSSLGDRQVVAQCLRIAEHLAAAQHDAGARERVSTLSARLATH